MGGQRVPQHPHCAVPVDVDLLPGDLRQRPASLPARPCLGAERVRVLALAAGRRFVRPYAADLHVHSAVLRNIPAAGRLLLVQRAVRPGHLGSLGVGLRHIDPRASRARRVHYRAFDLCSLRPLRQPREPPVVLREQDHGGLRLLCVHHAVERGDELPVGRREQTRAHHRARRAEHLQHGVQGVYIRMGRRRRLLERRRHRPRHHGPRASGCELVTARVLAAQPCRLNCCRELYCAAAQRSRCGPAVRVFDPEFAHSLRG
mmetsp:Transcript_61516/g.140667  ORF Transcript_61516/g.140667 Transcript_61516/m.140667 type:complete len:260 (+) Transcript_61516:1837-2616(+)